MSGNAAIECAIVIATRNRADMLERTLERLCALPERPPIVVVDNGSTDATAKVCSRFPERTRYLRLPRNIGAAARTVGARTARTPYVAFCDDDCVWTAGSLARALEVFARNPRVAVLNARIIVGESGKEDPACAAMRALPSGGMSGTPIVYFMAGACVMRTSAFLEAGGYHERYLIGAEESLLSLDLAARGWQLWYCEQLLVRHDPSPLNRNPTARRRLVLRNRLWTAFLRRSWTSSAHLIAEYARSAVRDRVARAALAEGLAGLPWIIRERRRVPREVELLARGLDRALRP